MENLKLRQTEIWYEVKQNFISSLILIIAKILFESDAEIFYCHSLILCILLFSLLNLSNNIQQNHILFMSYNKTDKGESEKIIYYKNIKVETEIPTWYCKCFIKKTFDISTPRHLSRISFFSNIVKYSVNLFTPIKLGLL